MSFEEVINISNFDGQVVWSDKNIALFEVGNFLGGGAAGTVYECEHIKSKEHYALKILNPLGYKLTTPVLLRKCNVLSKSKPFSDNIKDPMTKDFVWWLLNNSTKQYICAYFSIKSNCLKELSLNQCAQVWTTNPPGIDEIDDDDPQSILELTTLSNGQKLFLPKIPPKYLEFLRRRGRIFREIKNMRKISNHPNVIRLESVLELLQETKCTIFLLMELANGGELFDRIKVDQGTREETARYFFQQLLGGVKHCHDQGVCHRDLKPENLLLQDTGDKGTILKIADFGFSARFAMGNGNADDWSSNRKPDTMISHTVEDNVPGGSPVRVLKSIVGSPFYVAPEILQARGYDGSKADIWSLGVILYAMLAGNLPFGQDLSSCKRFKTFCKWVRQYNLKSVQLWESSLDFPDWLFPAKFSVAAKGLIVSMLHPDPICRISVTDAMTHPLCTLSDSSKSSASNASVGGVKPLGASLDSNAVFSKSDDSSKSIAMIVDNSRTTYTETIAINENLSRNIAVDEDRDDDQSGVFTMEEDQDISFTTRDVTRFVNSSPEVNKSSSVLDQEMRNPYPDSPHHLFHLASSPSGTRPPLAPPSVTHHEIDELITSDDETEDIEGAIRITPEVKPRKFPTIEEASGNHPPSFNDSVKRSTRFTTAVPATQVLTQVEAILQECISSRSYTPIGFIRKVDLNWESFRLEVWSTDVDMSTPPLCALQLYQLPSWYGNTPSSTPSRNSEVIYGYSPAIRSSLVSQTSILPSSSYQARESESSATQSHELYLVEFVRGQLEIFAFKRFYQWIRQRLSALVKRDYSVKIFGHPFSPKLDNQYLQNFHQHS